MMVEGGRMKSGRFSGGTSIFRLWKGAEVFQYKFHTEKWARKYANEYGARRWTSI
jgi:hypothetical protein